MHPITINVDGFVSELQKSFVVYACQIKGETDIQYIGMTYLREILEFHDAMGNSLWRQMFIEQKQPMQLVAMMMFGNRRQAVDEQRKFIESFKPYCNIHGRTIPIQAQNVKCDQDGRVYETAAAAARAYGIHAGNLSKHLNGMVGFRTAGKGLTFSRTTEAVTR